MKEYNFEQGSKEWHDLRTGRITGSHFDSIMKSPKQRKLPFNDTQMDYLYSVAAEVLTGIEEFTFQSKDMERGITMEPFAKRAYEQHYFVKIRDVGFFSDDEYTGSSPDGIIGDNERIIEIKCPKQKTHMEYYHHPDLLLKAYFWQVVGECYYTGIDSAVIVSYHPDFPDDRQIVTNTYFPTKEDYETLKSRLDECVDFVNELVDEQPIDVEF